MPIHIPTIDDVRAAETAIRPHVSPAPLVRSYPLEKEIGLPEGRRVWLKDYGWTPVGSFKLLGALNWVANNLERIGSRTVVAHSSGNFASGISYAGMRFGKRVHRRDSGFYQQTVLRIALPLGAQPVILRLPNLS